MHERPSDDLSDNDRREAVLRAAGEHVPEFGGPHVWIASVESYESGAPEGTWIAVEQRKDDFERALAAVVPTSPSGEPTPWGVYAAVGLDRHPPDVITSVGELRRLAEFVRDDLRAFHAWASHGENDTDWLLRFDEHYLGRYANLNDWLNLEIERAGWERLIDRSLPAEISAHVEINLASLAHELLATGTIFVLPDQGQGGIFIFRGIPDE